jgi:hypothetical protein
MRGVPDPRTKRDTLSVLEPVPVAFVYAYVSKRDTHGGNRPECVAFVNAGEPVGPAPAARPPARSASRSG